MVLRNLIRFPLLTLWITIFVNQKLVYGAPGNFKLELRINQSSNGKIPYQEGPFNNIQRLLDMMAMKLNSSENLYTHLCARGVWIFYPSPFFAVENPKTLNGILAYASEGFKCITLEEIGPVGSVRPLTYSLFKYTYISIFQFSNFLGTRTLLGRKNNAVGDGGIQYTPDTILGSLITVGKGRWTIVLHDGTRICIQPKKTDAPVCFLSNIVDKVNFFPASGVKFARRHCRRTDPGLIVDLTECYDIGQGLIRSISQTWPFGPPSNDTQGPGNATDTNITSTDCNTANSEDILTPKQKYLIEGRLNGSLGSGDWIQAIRHPQNIWKTELFDKCLDIFMFACDSRVIEQEYLILFASLFFHHLDNAWGEDGTLFDLDVPEDEWMEINHELETCFTAAAEGEFRSISEAASTKIIGYKSLDELIGDFDSEFGYKSEFDHILEINWVMANVVASVCHKYLNNVNFLHRFWDIYHSLYFSPIEEQWQNPQDVEMAYKYIFGGFGMAKSFAKIATCAVESRQYAPSVKPYIRPLDHDTSIYFPQPNPGKEAGSGKPDSKPDSMTEGNPGNTNEPLPTKPDPKPLPFDPKPLPSKPDPKPLPAKPDPKPLPFDPKPPPAKPDPKPLPFDPKPAPAKPDPKPLPFDPKPPPAKPDPKPLPFDPKPPTAKPDPKPLPFDPKPLPAKPEPSPPKGTNAEDEFNWVSKKGFFSKN